MSKGDVAGAGRDAPGWLVVLVVVVGVFCWWAFALEGCDFSGDGAAVEGPTEGERELAVVARVWVEESFVEAEYVSGVFDVARRSGVVRVSGVSAFGGPVLSRYELEFDGGDRVVNAVKLE